MVGQVGFQDFKLPQKAQDMHCLLLQRKTDRLNMDKFTYLVCFSIIMPWAL